MNDKMFVAWQILGLVLVIVVIVILGVLVVSDKHVDGYYLSEGQGSAVCVYAHWTWHTDEKAFCTDDYRRALEFNAYANETVQMREWAGLQRSDGEFETGNLARLNDGAFNSAKKSFKQLAKIIESKPEGLFV